MRSKNRSETRRAATAHVRGGLRPALLAACLGASAMVGCGSAERASICQPLPPELSVNDPDAQMEFWHALPQRRVTSNDEAFHALLLFADGTDAAEDYAARVEAMRSRGLLPPGFDGAAGDPARRGTVAVAVAKAIKVRGGATMRLFGLTPRYATRELQYLGLFPPSSPQQTFTGPELLGVIGRAEDYQRLNAESDFATAAANAAEAARVARAAQAEGEARVARADGD